MGKKLAVGLFVPALSSVPAAAADDDSDRMFGITIGPTWSGQTEFPAYYTQAALPGVTIGISTRLPVSASRSFQPELVYTKYGKRWGNISVSYEHLAMPLLFRHNYDMEPLTPFLVYGPQVAFRLRSTATYGNLFYSYSFNLAGYLYGPLPLTLPIDIGMTVGTGFTIPIHNMEMDLGLRLYHGLYPHSGFNGEIYLNRQINAQVGIFF